MKLKLIIIINLVLLCSVMGAQKVLPLDILWLDYENWSNIPHSTGSGRVGQWKRDYSNGTVDELLLTANLEGISEELENATFRFKVSGGTLGNSGSQLVELYEQNKTDVSLISAFYSLDYAPWNTRLGTITVSQINGWFEISGEALTALVRSWINGDKNNDGFILQSDMRHVTYFLEVESAELVLDFKNTLNNDVAKFDLSDLANATVYLDNAEFRIDENNTENIIVDASDSRIVNNTREFIVKNYLGSTVTSMNEDGEVVGAIYDYFPFGRQKVVAQSSNQPITRTFTDKELDVINPDAEGDGEGYYYFGARYLDADIGYWLSGDPARQFPSPYSYIGNGFAPIKMIDPDGNNGDDNAVTMAVGGYGFDITGARISQAINNGEEGYKIRCMDYDISLTGKVGFGAGIKAGAVSATVDLGTYNYVLSTNPKSESFISRMLGIEVGIKGTNLSAGVAFGQKGSIDKYQHYNPMIGELSGDASASVNFLKYSNKGASGELSSGGYKIGFGAQLLLGFEVAVSATPCTEN